MNNSIFTIRPYKRRGRWVFDDARVGLVKEPFVRGADTMIDVATAHIPNAGQGFLAVFSASTFPQAQIVLEWAREDGGGNVSSCFSGAVISGGETSVPGTKVRR